MNCLLNIPLAKECYPDENFKRYWIKSHYQLTYYCITMLSVAGLNPAQLADCPYWANINDTAPSNDYIDSMRHTWILQYFEENENCTFGDFFYYHGNAWACIYEGLYWQKRFQQMVETSTVSE